MQCVILAGGRGTRMAPATDEIPKALLPVAGRPFADWQLGWLASQGVDRVTYSIGYLGDLIRDHVGTGENWGLGVDYVDDSKGTNVGAMVEALAATRGAVILIAGGIDKGGDYGPLRAPLEEKVRMLILFGAAREKMRAALAGATVIESVTTIVDAVKMAAAHASEGDTVMLSPACSSFDQFKDYAERGRVFQELVRAL